MWLQFGHSGIPALQVVCVTRNKGSIALLPPVSGVQTMGSLEQVGNKVFLVTIFLLLWLIPYVIYIIRYPGKNELWKKQHNDRQQKSLSSRSVDERVRKRNAKGDHHAFYRNYRSHIHSLHPVSGVYLFDLYLLSRDKICLWCHATLTLWTIPILAFSFSPPRNATTLSSRSHSGKQVTDKTT